MFNETILEKYTSNKYGYKLHPLHLYNNVLNILNIEYYNLSGMSFLLYIIKYSPKNNKYSDFISSLFDKIKSLKQFINNDINREKECAICLQNNCDIKLNCEHVYHYYCLKQILNNNSCPICNRNILEIDYLGDYDKWFIACNLAFHSYNKLLEKWLLKYPEISNALFSDTFIEDGEVNDSYSLVKSAIDGVNIDNLLLLSKKFNHNVSTIFKENKNYLTRFCHLLTGSKKTHSKNIIKMLKKDISIVPSYRINLIISNFIRVNLDSILISFIDVKSHLNKILESLYNENKYKSLKIVLNKYNVSMEDCIALFKSIHYNSTIKITTIYTILKYLDENFVLQDIKSEIAVQLFNNHNYNILHYLSIRKNSLKTLKLFNKFIKISEWSKEDESEFTPLMDCARYGFFKEFVYIFNIAKKLKFKFYQLCVYTTLTTHTLFELALQNNDIRIIQFILDNLNCKLFTFSTESTKSYYSRKKFLNKIKLLDQHNLLVDNENIVNILCDLDYEYIKNRVFAHYIIKKYINTNNFNDFIRSYYLAIDTDKALNIKTNFGKKMGTFLFHNLHIYKDLIKHATKYDYCLIFEKLITYYCYQDIRIKKLDHIKNNIYINAVSHNLYDPNTDNNLRLNCNHCKQTRKKCIMKIFTDFNIKKKSINTNIIGFVDDYDLFDIFVIINKGIPKSCLNKYNLKYYINKPYFRSWILFVKLFKRLIKIKYNKNLKLWKNDLFQVINEIDYYPKLNNKKIYKNIGKKFDKMILENFKSPPSHITPNKLISLLNEDLLITEKIDGLHIVELSNEVMEVLEPKIHFNDLSLEAEYLEKNNIYIIYDINNTLLDEKIEILNYLRDQHKYIPVLKNFNFLEDNFNDYYKLEKEAYESYLKNHNSTKPLWWVKPMWNLNLGISLGLIQKMLNTNDAYCIYPKDGLILYTNKEKFKLKPQSHLTLDLLNDGDTWITYDKKMIEIYNPNKYSFGIWRCYWNKDKNMWEPKEKRLDKKNPNDSSIEKIITKQHLFPWKMTDIIYDKPYYQNLNYREYCELNFSEVYIKNKKVLDLGCGYKSNTLAKKNIHTKWVGLDLDLYILEKNVKMENVFWLWGDFRKKLNEKQQSKILNNNLWINCMSDKWDILDDKFDTIIMHNCVHYAAINETTWQNLFYEINSKSKKGTQIIIRFLDGTLLNKFLDRTIVNETDYIKRIKSKNDDVTNFWIKIYYSKIHTKPLIEPVINKLLLEEQFYKYNWIIEKDNYHLSNNWNESKSSKQNDILWKRYQNCFRTCIFHKL